MWYEDGCVLIVEGEEGVVILIYGVLLLELKKEDLLEVKEYGVLD